MKVYNSNDYDSGEQELDAYFLENQSASKDTFSINYIVMIEFI